MPLSGLSGSFGGYYKTENIKEDSSTVVYCGYLNRHWGHFLVDAVNRLWYIVENNPAADKYVFSGDDGIQKELSGNFKEFFDLLGLSSKLEIVTAPVRYSKIIIPEISFKTTQHISKHYISIFDTLIRNVMASHSLPEKFDKIFLSRSQFVKARMYESGLDMLDHYFEKNGYKILFPEKLPLRDLIFYLQNAEECACASGTIPHNILFGYSGQKLAIVERYAVINPVQNAIDLLRNTDVTYIDGNYSLYPVSFGSGPFFYAYNKYMKKFSEDREYSAPDEKYLTEKQKKIDLKQYCNTYKNEYYISSGAESWYQQYAETLFEAYCESFEDLKEYLTGNKNFIWKQIFEWRFVKKLIKNTIAFLRVRK